MEWTIDCIDEDSLDNIGNKLADYVNPGVVFCLSGSLGVGKTTLARAIIQRACNFKSDIPSPTFTIVQSYQVATGFEIWHLDLYRLNSMEEAVVLGLEDALIDHCCIIEWSDIVEQIMPADRIHVHLEFQNKVEESLVCQRMITIKTSNVSLLSFDEPQAKRIS